jgi:hypothetical protein
LVYTYQIQIITRLEKAIDGPRVDLRSIIEIELAIMSWRQPYIQVGGFKGDTNPWCTRRCDTGSYQELDVLVDIIAGPHSPIRESGRIELILGR